MGEDFGLFDIDVRQRKSGKNKSQHEDIVSSFGGSDGGHGSNKRRRRGRGGGGNDKLDGIKMIPEEEISIIQPKEKKGKVVITKKSTESDDDDDDDDGGVGETDDAYDSSVEDEESSGSWLFKLFIIVVIVSLGLSLIWFTDGSSSSTDLDGNSGESFDESGDSGYVQENIDEDRGDIGEEETNYRGYQDNQVNQEQWEYSDGNPEIIAEVSETIDESSSKFNEYLEPRDEGYFGDEQIVQTNQESESWTQDYQSNKQLNSPDEQEMVYQQADYIQQPEQYQEQYQNPVYHEQPTEEPKIEHVPEPEIKPEQSIEPVEPYDPQPYQSYEYVNNNEQSAQFETVPEIPETKETTNDEIYYECPEGSYWDGLSCVNPESFVQMDEFNNNNDNINKKQPEPSNNENNFYPDNQ